MRKTLSIGKGYTVEIPDEEYTKMTEQEKIEFDDYLARIVISVKNSGRDHYRDLKIRNLEELRSILHSL